MIKKQDLHTAKAKVCLALSVGLVIILQNHIVFAENTTVQKPDTQTLAAEYLECAVLVFAFSKFVFKSRRQNFGDDECKQACQ